MLRFNQGEYKYLEELAESYDMDITKRGVLSPLLRRLVLGKQLKEKDRLPDTVQSCTSCQQGRQQHQPIGQIGAP